MVTNTVKYDPKNSSIHIFNVGSCSLIEAEKSLSGTVTSGFAIGDIITYKLKVTNLSTGSDA